MPFVFPDKSSLGRRTFLLMLGLTLLSRPTAADEEPARLNPKDKLVVETVLRLKGFDLESSAPAKAAVLRYLRAQPGTDQYFELIKRFQPTEIAEDLAAFSLVHAGDTSGVRGAELLFAMQRGDLLSDAVKSEQTETAVAAVTLIGYVGGSKGQPILAPLVAASSRPLAVRSAAVTALGRGTEGQEAILELVRAGQLPADLNFVAANVLLSSEEESMRHEAARYLTLPATADSRPLPPVAELVQRRGDAAAGAIVFRKTGTCINCHKVRGEGKEVGPDLSEIGSKLSREAVYVSILDPSAAISHNFETYILVTDEGRTFTGLLISDADDSVTLRTREGIDKKVDRQAVEVLKKQTLSLMPQDLQKLLTVEQLIDVVEYVLTLRKSEPATTP